MALSDSFSAGLRKFVSPEFIFGDGASDLAGIYAINLGARKVLVVSDAGVIAAGWTDNVIRSIVDNGLSCALYSDVSPNPRAEEVMAGIEVYEKEGCDVIVAVGGGSPIDCAKCIGIVSTNHRNILEFEGVDQIPVPGPPLICIPTTGGTSADVSQFAIISDLARKVKIAIISKMVVPDIALIDPVTTTTVSPYLTAATGMDAFSHGVEAYVSNASSFITDIFALNSIRLISQNLVQAVREPKNMVFRDNMMRGSLEAGLAFSNASLGLTHAMTHSLGGYLDLPHGMLNSIVLPHVIRFNYEAVPERYNRIGEAMGLNLDGSTDGEKKATIIDAIDRLRREAGITLTLEQIGVKKGDIPVLASKAMKDACKVTNPCPATPEDVMLIYEEAL